MAGQFGRLAARLHSVGVARLADTVGRYSEQGHAPVEGLELIIDRNLQRAGPDGLYPSDQVGISWAASAMPTASRGGLFEVGAQRFMVEELIVDDGYMLTAACMVAP